MAQGRYYVSVKIGNESGTSILCLPQDVSSPKKIRELSKQGKVSKLSEDKKLTHCSLLGCVVRDVQKIKDIREALNVLRGVVGVG